MKDPLDLVIGYIDSQGGEIPDLDLTSSKVSERASLIEYPERPDCIAFSIERHQGILGSRWEPRTPMNAFVTCFPCYLFDPKANHLSCIESLCEPYITVENYDFIAEEMLDVSFQIETIEPGKFRYQEVMSNEEGVVTSVDELMKEASRIIDGLNFDTDREELGNWASESECDEVLTELMEACRKHVQEAARKAWLDMEELEQVDPSAGVSS